MDQVCGNNDISNVNVCIQASCDTGVDHYFCFEIIDQNLCADCCILAQTANAEMTDAQIADIKAAQEKMMESAQKLFAKMYEQTQQAGGQAGPNPGAGAGAGAAQGSNEAGYGDDVVDADYKEV